MTSQMKTKVRLVRCPTCRQVLAELADVSVYKCGGCGAILQAKNRKRDTHDTGPLVHEADPTQENGLDHVMNPSTDESDLEKILEGCGSGFNCRKEGLGGSNQSHEHHSSDVISCHENTGSLPETSGHAGSKEEKIPLVQYGAENSNELGDDDSELPVDTSVSNEISSSPELNIHEDRLLVQGPGTCENESSTLSPRKRDESLQTSENFSYGGQIYSQNCKKELPINTSFSMDLSSSYESCENGDLSPVSENDSEADVRLKNHSISRSSATLAFLDTSLEDQIRRAQGSSIATDSPDNQMFPLSEPTKQAQEETLPVFQRISSADTLENIPQIYARTDLGVTLRSSTAKHYYDYGVNTSCEETEDKLPTLQFRASRRNFKDAEFKSPNTMPKRDEFMVNHRMSSETKLPPRSVNSSASLSAKKHHTTKGSKWNRGELLEPTGYSRPDSSTMSMETGEYWSRPPIYSKGSQLVRNGSSTSNDKKGLPERTVDPESDKMELLRMVYELQDQLNRAHVSKDMSHGRIPSRVAKNEEHFPVYSNLFPPNSERYPDPRYLRNPGRLDQEKTLLQQGKVPRMAFSGDATQFRHEDDCSCLHCYHQKWHYSAELPRHAYFDEWNTMVYPRHNNHSPYRFSSASPWQYKPSRFSSWSHDTMSDGIRQNNYEVKKKQPAKQHFRPIAGGAPIIACYSCTKILQLPVEFLLFKRRCYRLRCSACNVVLKFSLQNRIHIVKYNPGTPPPSEVGGYIETTNMASASCQSDHQHGDPVSSSDGYGQLLHRSPTDIIYSSPAPPSETLNEISVRQKMSVGNPFETKKDGKKTIVQDSRNSYKSSRETFELGGPSSLYEPDNVFSEIEEVQPEGCSPLHRLMGYPSPSHLVFQYSADV